MEISIIFKIAAIGIVITVLGQVLKHSGREEQAFLLSLAGLIIVLFWIVPYISELFETMESLFSLLIKKDKPEIAAGLSVCASLLIFFMAIKQLSAVIEFAKEVIRQLPVETSYFATMLKMLGIAYSAEFSSQICKDSGHGAIAAQIDFFAKTAIVMMSIPTLVYLAKIMGDII